MSTDYAPTRDMSAIIRAALADDDEAATREYIAAQDAEHGTTRGLTWPAPAVTGSVHNHLVTEWLADYQLYLADAQGKHVAAAVSDARRSMLIGQAAALFRYELGER